MRSVHRRSRHNEPVDELTASDSLTEVPSADPAPPDPVPAEGATDGRGPLLGRAGEILAGLFPEAPQQAGPRLPAAAVPVGYALAIVAGAVVLLLRQSGHPAWDTMWAEDRTIFLPAAVLHPWSSIWQPYAGYLELVPRLIAEVAAALPFADAAVCFAVSGALIASGCAALVFHASRGHVHSAVLRVLLAAGVLLLPQALIELANSGVDSLWYLMFAVFWVLFWRPRGWLGMTVAALVGLVAVSSQVLVVFFAPIVLARLIALPRVREHAVTLGLAAGVLLQLPVMLGAPPLPPSPDPAKGSHLAAASDFYAQHVLLASVAGWHLAERLEDRLGHLGMVALAAAVVVLLAEWAYLRGSSRVRIMVVTTLGYGLVLCIIPAMLRPQVLNPAAVTPLWIPGTRYAMIPVLLIDSLAVIAVDAFLRRDGARGWDTRRVLAVLVLFAVLSAGWISDYRAANLRATSPLWRRAVSTAQASCRDRPQDSRVWLPILATRLPCAAVDR